MIEPAFRPCAVIPTYDNPRTIRTVVERVRAYLPDVIVVDDGSGPEGRAAVDGLGHDGLARVVRRTANGGKGAAVKTGLLAARELGFSHALQIDADGQHNIEDIPRFIETARTTPAALVLGYPQFDETVNRGRSSGVNHGVLDPHRDGGRAIRDPMCGFRVYPLAAATSVRCGDRMDFEHRGRGAAGLAGCAGGGGEVVNVPTKVRYLSKADGGVSHFRMLGDNARISWLHTRSGTHRVRRLLTWPIRTLLR